LENGEKGKIEENREIAAQPGLLLAISGCLNNA
jgi:hypothetical protein